MLTVLSLFLGVETLLCTAVVTGGSDATNTYMQKPDFILAGDFCEEAKEGIISEPDEEALDPLVTEQIQQICCGIIKRMTLLLILLPFLNQ